MKQEPWLPLADLQAMRPSHKARVEQYLYDLPLDEQMTADDMASQIYDSRNPLARTIVLIPVAAQQEASNITNAIYQYAKQDAMEKFSVLLYPNAPSDADHTETSQTLSLIRRSIGENDIDVRSFDLAANDNATIGQLRREMWNAALRLAYYEGAFDDNESHEVLGVNHDIDVVDMTPRYISRIQSYRDQRVRRFVSSGLSYADMTPRGTVMSHAYNVDYPCASQVVRWYYFSLAQIPDTSYEASLVIPFVHYAKYGGFSPEASTYETETMIPEGGAVRKIPGTIIKTSPRRFVDRLHEGGLDKVWAGDTFGNSDLCRNEQFLEDISYARKEEVVIDTLESHELPLVLQKASMSLARQCSAYAGTATYVDRIQQQLEANLKVRIDLAATVLRRYIEAPIAAGIVKCCYDPSTLASAIVEDALR